MSSGIEVTNEILQKFEEVRQRKYSTIVLKISDDGKDIVLDKTYGPSSGDPESEWKEIVADLSESTCRFLICDFQVKETPTVTKSKLIMISWTPEYSPIRSKMVYASTLVNVINKVEPQKSIQATEMPEVEYGVLKDSVFSK